MVSALSKKSRRTSQPGPLRSWLDGHRTAGAIIEIALVIGGALLLSWLIKTFLMQPFYIPSDSMNDTLLTGDRVVVSKMVPEVFDVHRGDVVVFRDSSQWLGAPAAPAQSGGIRGSVNRVLTTAGVLPQESGQHLIKRIIGVAGDDVKCCSSDGRLEVNGVAITEPYLKPGSIPSEINFHIQVPADSLWVMGDNRQHSEDSRAHLGDPGSGFVPMKDVVGSAFVRIWPIDRFSWLTNPGDTFAEVP